MNRLIFGLRLSLTLLLIPGLGCSTKTPKYSDPVANATNSQDTIEAAAKSGVDYVGSSRNVHREIEHLSQARFDGASSEGNAAVLASLLACLGDSFFGGCLASESPAVREEVQQQVLYGFGWDGEIPSRLALAKQYPKTLPTR